MFASKNRLRKKNDINNVFKKGRTIASGLFFLKLVENNLKTNRFAFVVSKKISSRAVRRNIIKRRLREAIKKIVLPQGFDIIILAKPLILNKSFQEIYKNINEVFNSKINKIIPK